MTEINQHGSNNLYVEENKGNINIYSSVEEVKLSVDEISYNLETASVDLSSYKNTFKNSIHIPRNETNILYQWIQNEIPVNDSPIAILAGNAGYGKSVIFRELLEKLIKEKIPVLGIKADRIHINNLQDLNNELALDTNIESIFKTLSSREQRFVLLIDQIDALSQSLSTDRKPLDTYHRLIQKLSRITNIRIIISCRIYDLNYDPLLSQYKNKKVFHVSPLSFEEVDDVINRLNIPINAISDKLKIFLSVPLHLELYTKISNPTKLGDSITLQKLYDDIWENFILNKPSEYNLNSLKVQDVMYKIVDKMYEIQQLAINQNLFISEFNPEIQYLLSQDILLKQENNKLQFIHQSFFDYTYARTFVEKGNNIADSLKDQHQGLFIRSRVGQVFTYLRELDEDLYIQQLKEVILGDYRYHIKLLLINKLGFNNSPLESEKRFIKTRLSENENLFKLFIESIYSEEWFKFLLTELNGYEYFKKDNKEIIIAIFPLCIRILNINPLLVIDFLSELNKISFSDKEWYFGNILNQIPALYIHHSFELFQCTKKDWQSSYFYHYLSKSLPNNPDFVISELKNKLIEFLNENTSTAIDFIPGNHEGFNVYKELYNSSPQKAIKFFLEAIELIAKKTKIEYKEEYANEIKISNSWAYMHYSPLSNFHQNHERLYNIILKYFEDLLKNEFELAKNTLIPFLNSTLSILVNLPITFMVKYPDETKEYSLNILTDKKFYLAHCELLKYNIKELISVSYSLFSREEKIKINEVLIGLSPEWEKVNINNKNGVTPYGYTQIGYTAFEFISMINENDRKNYPEIEIFYNEKKRKYGKRENNPPKGIESKSGYTAMSSTAYEKMNNSQWIESFKKYTSDDHFNWDTLTKTGHAQMFESYVSQNPEQFIDLIEKIIQDLNVIPLYCVYGLKGLKKGNFDPERTRDIFISFIHTRKEKLDRESLLYSVWLIDYFIDTSVIDKRIIGLLCHLVINYEDGKMLNDDPLNDGINTIRGAAADKLVLCYKFPEFEEEIFSSLEILAEKGAVQSRGPAFFQLALLNHLNIDRNLNLFLKLTHDFDFRLLKMPLHNHHPLVYLINVDFSKLIDFFKKAITVKGSENTITHALFLAWLKDYEGSEELLSTLLTNTIIAKQRIVRLAFESLSDPTNSDKCWQILYRFLEVDDMDLGNVYEVNLSLLQSLDIKKVVPFLEEYNNSNIGKYKEYTFYSLLLKLAKDIPEKCIEWSLQHSSPTDQQLIIGNERIQILIQSYNAIRKYDKNDLYLETAMDAFDQLLQQPEFRRDALNILTQIDA